jgi:hypothetical protein
MNLTASHLTNRYGLIGISLRWGVANQVWYV